MKQRNIESVCCIPEAEAALQIEGAWLTLRAQEHESTRAREHESTRAREIAGYVKEEWIFQ